VEERNAREKMVQQLVASGYRGRLKRAEKSHLVSRRGLDCSISATRGGGQSIVNPLRRGSTTFETKESGGRPAGGGY